MKKPKKKTILLCLALIAVLVIGVGIGYFVMPTKTITKNVVVEKPVIVEKNITKIVYKDRVITKVIHETEGSSVVSDCAKLHDITKCKPLVNGQRV